jgi:streptomycin 6-kinase
VPQPRPHPVRWGKNVAFWLGSAECGPSLVPGEYGRSHTCMHRLASVDDPLETRDLGLARSTAEAVAGEWGLSLGEPFALSRFSFVAPVVGMDAVLKVAWEGDDESLHEAEALSVWNGDGAVRVLRSDASRRVLLEERALPGSDISDLDDSAALGIALELGRRLWRPAGEPFRPIEEHVPRWLDNNPSPLTGLARELFSSFRPGRCLVHGDFHHHNVLRHSGRFVAIDPKPYLADREYDVYPWLHNPLGYRMTRRDRTEARIARFVAAGLDDWLIRVWAVIRGAYLTDDLEEQAVLRSLL